MLVSRLPVAALVLLVALAGTADARSAAGRARVVHGYPYARHCPEDGVEEVVDRWGMYACNCTSYAAWALHANQQRTDWFIRGSMDAWNWPNVARLRGLKVGSTPRPGDIAVWPKVARPFGHVAYVTRVHGDGTFDVAEYNLPGDRSHRFRFDRRTAVSARGATFVHVPERR